MVSSCLEVVCCWLIFVRETPINVFRHAKIFGDYVITRKYGDIKLPEDL